jgi:hypothetical protein
MSAYNLSLFIIAVVVEQSCEVIPAYESISVIPLEFCLPKL